MDREKLIELRKFLDQLNGRARKARHEASLLLVKAEAIEAIAVDLDIAIEKQARALLNRKDGGSNE